MAREHGASTRLVAPGVRAEAVEQALSALVRSHPAALERLGPDAEESLRSDLRLHVDFLAAAHLSHSPDYFSSYVTWAASVLDVRGIPIELLTTAFERFAASLDAATGERALGDIARSGIAQLERRIPPPLPTHADGTSFDLPPLVGALVRGERHAVWHEIEAENVSGRSYVDIAVDSIQPALYEVGRLWHLHRISVAQEHLATAQAVHVLTRLFARAAMLDDTGRRALVACVAGNHHSVGPLMISDAFALRGWETQYLGADVPTDDLVRQITAFRPQVVGLSLSMPGHIDPARTAIERIRARFGADGPTIAVGGLPLNALDGLWAHLGADSWSPDARSAAMQLT